MNSLSYRVDGVPTPKGSLRAFYGKSKKTGNMRAFMVEDNANTKPWMQAVCYMTMNAVQNSDWEVKDVPIAITIDFFLPKPKSAKKRMLASRKPDIDKLSRAVMDAIQMTGIVFQDDSRVCDLHSKKFYADGVLPGAQITISEIR